MGKLRVDYRYTINGQKKEASFEIEGDGWEELDVYEAIVEAENIELPIIARRAGIRKGAGFTDLYVEAFNQHGVTDISPGTGTRI